MSSTINYDRAASAFDTCLCHVEAATSGDHVYGGYIHQDRPDHDLSLLSQGRILWVNKKTGQLESRNKPTGALSWLVEKIWMACHGFTKDIQIVCYRINQVVAQTASHPEILLSKTAPAHASPAIAQHAERVRKKAAHALTCLAKRFAKTNPRNITCLNVALRSLGAEPFKAPVLDLTHAPRIVEEEADSIDIPDDEIEISPAMQLKAIHQFIETFNEQINSPVEMNSISIATVNGWKDERVFIPFLKKLITKAVLENSELFRNASAEARDRYINAAVSVIIERLQLEPDRLRDAEYIGTIVQETILHWDDTP